MVIHVGIIDQDPVRLITPLLDETIPVKQVVFVGVHSQHKQFLRLAAIIEPRGIRAEFFEIPDEINVANIRQRIETLVQRFASEASEVWFNASCGLRHRLLTAYEVFRTYHCPIYVIEPFSDEMCWLYPDGKPQRQIEDRIQISDYLTIFGARAELTEVAIPASLNAKLMQIGKKWASNALELGPGLATLNYLATTCRKEQKLDVELSDKQQGYRELAFLIEDLVNTGLAAYQNGILTFTQEEARRFANGEWLENYVHNTLAVIKETVPTIQDHSLNVQVYRKIGEREVRNELDVATIVNNKLHIIECKTKGMRDDGDDTLYKLESLRDLLGGLQARAMLVSFRPLRHHDLIRAEDLGLTIIGPDELNNLQEHLTTWVKQAGGEQSIL
ncbi:Card1-like endonuclease domain-containing protein [Thaumasiovibrio sp. DFM-14]|uniref:Card1-like endonuclease domain-containing protein n=1 Tax=Thaumasiovibrio sp. DFM-14 TaxID=3384792 RepID=UPI0039A0585C